jgi:NADH-quinone oxidoreductase subunit J
MSTPGIGLFLLCGLAAMLSAIGTIAVKSPIRAAMSLLVHIVALSGLFLTLHAHLLAALQLLVYAGAVVVLFVFVIMMIGPGVADAPATRGMVIKTAAAAMMAVLTLALTAALAVVAPVRGLIDTCTEGAGRECKEFGGVAGFSADLFVTGVLPFELISILLTVAIIGAIAVARGHTPLAAEVMLRPRHDRQAREAEQSAPGPSTEVATSGGH